MNRLKEIEHDKEQDRHYIPLAGGYEFQTKGKGSTVRLLCPDGKRYIVNTGMKHSDDALARCMMVQHTKYKYRDAPALNEGKGLWEEVKQAMVDHAVENDSAVVYAGTLDKILAKYPPVTDIDQALEVVFTLSNALERYAQRVGLAPGQNFKIPKGAHGNVEVRVDGQWQKEIHDALAAAAELAKIHPRLAPVTNTDDKKVS